MGLKFETNLWSVYRDILQFAPRWLVIMGHQTFEQFSAELASTRATVIKLRSGFAVLDEYAPGVRVTIHPCFTRRLSPEDMTEFREVLEVLFTQYTLRRVQIRVFETAGHTIRRLLRELGFTKEAVLSNYARDLCSLDHRLISSEIWSIVK